MTTTNSQRGITDQRLTANARRLRPLLCDYAAASDIMRKMPDEVLDGLTEAGFFRLLKPRHFGGYDVNQRTVLEVILTLGQANASAAWLVGIAAGGSALARRGSERLQAEIFSNRDARIAGSLNPGTARRVDGGLCVRGNWPYSSGAPHADWAAICAAVPDEASDIVPYVCFAPVAEVQVHDTWHMAGMRGTASQTFVADELFIPEHRTIALDALGDGQHAGSTSDELPLAPLFNLYFVATLLGIGQAAAELVIEAAPRKAMTSTCFARQSDSVGVQIQVAEAKLKLRSAGLLVFDVADELDAGTLVAGEAGYPRRARVRAQCAFAARQTMEAVQTLLDVCGAGGFAEASRMQQYWRDASVAARHAALNVHVGYEIYGKSLLGVAERISPLV
ncbi:acyl-CoA dehydrogenase family protein [Mycobacterium kubicae]|uniref:acyl-CoA dehydrogenase family protein n=1 Tax=Mycobacterium kubicae TaxID=120959 RepID=UPI0010423848|nr:acyl-CoA dehydrogenase family protein [Mycobacterium kubicae]